MKKLCLTAVLTLTCLLGVGISARAQDTQGVVAKVPFEFVAAGETMPAGKYSIGRISADASSGLIILGENSGAFLHPVLVEDPSPDQQTLTFEYVGGKYFLSKVRTPGGVYTISVPRATVALAQVKDKGTVSSSGTN